MGEIEGFPIFSGSASFALTSPFGFVTEAQAFPSSPGIILYPVPDIMTEPTPIEIAAFALQVFLDRLLWNPPILPRIIGEYGMKITSITYQNNELIVLGDDGWRDGSSAGRKG
jgi:hypothetical protein